MKKTLTTLIMTVIGLTVFGQTFQGEIIYHNNYESKLPNVTNEQFTAMMGSTQNYVIKGGNYKSSSNGTMFQWQLYINQENKLYNKMSNSETIFWNDGATNTDEVINVETKQKVTEILGYMCDEVILNCKSGVQKYYFNSEINVDISLFKNHQFGNWYDFLKVSKALPLKIISENAQFSLTSIAIKVTEMEIDDKLFQLPENSKTVKSPY